MAGDKFPITIKAGSFQATVYRKQRLVRGRPYVAFRLSYYAADGRRVLRDFGDVEAAKIAAREAAAAGQAGRIDAVDFTAGDRALLVQLNTLAASIGTTPLPALQCYVDAVRRLPAGCSLGDAVESYIRRHPSGAAKVTIAAAAEAVMAAKDAAGLSESYVRKLRGYLRRFADAFGTGLLRDLQPADVGRWLMALPNMGNRSRHNHHEGVVALAHHALEQRWIGRELVDELSGLKLPKVEAVGEVGVFTAREIQLLLDASPDDIRATVAIGAFAGLRTEEIHRLEWQDVRLAERVIVVGADKAKTASRRVVPIVDNLAAWLAPLWQTEGDVDPSPTSKAMTHRWRRVGERVGVTWKHNALRHSFISCRLAVTQDPAKVAFEAGNSPAMVHRHYKAMTTEGQGHEWFSVRPSAGQADVIPLRQTG
jgi:integrase